MTRAGIIKRIAFVCVVLLAALNWVAIFQVQDRVFPPDLMDFRAFGYGQDDVQMFVSGLSFEQAAAYRDVYLILDILFIGCSFALIMTIAGGFGRSGLWWLIPVFAVAFSVTDLGENYLVAQMVDGEFGASHGFFARLAAMLGLQGFAPLASLFTQVKFASLLLVLAGLLICWRQEGRASA